VIVGKDSVFMDVDTIALGRDFRQVLRERLGIGRIGFVVLPTVRTMM
jgi:hypothetical protein